MKNKTKKIVLIGESNDKYTLIEKGLEPGSQVYLLPPENPEKFRLTGKELIPEIRRRELTASNQ